ncbi:MAG: site-2 protease family protein, partial [Clostridia bacterium]|nr:site-2 protease family protein [Clostridia bacterium]
MIPALAVVLVFGGLIFVHELGHFLAAKWAGVAVSEFALGFGPRLAGWRRAETEYSLRLLPLGGFVRMAGMGAEGEAAPPVPGSGFGDKPLAWRVGIIAAGPFMNFLLASLLFTVIFGVVGVPRRPTLVLDRVEPGSPAAAVGLRPGDRIVAVDGRPVEAWSDVQARVSR